MEIDTSHEIYAPVAIGEPDDDDILNSEERPNKRRRKKSIVWEHFTIESAGPSRMKACCKHCKKSFAYINGPKLAGTSHLKRHISLGICSGGLQKSEISQNASGTKSDPPKRRYRSSAGYAGIPFDQDRCTRDIAKMIIQHDYPLHIVEHPAFIDFVRTLHPQYNMVSFNTIQGECVALYLREKQSLLDHISEIPGRVNLTLDLAISNLSIGYAFLTGHFIDSDWNLERQILNVIMLPFPDSDYAFNQAVISCMSDWHLENKLFTITLDKSYSNETIMGNLRGLLPVKNSLLLNGQLLKGNCYARLLSQLAQDAMGQVQEPIKRIRESVKYVKTSETHEEKFAELRQQLQVPSTRELVVDDQTKWNTTYHMLAAACELKEVFGCLDTADPVYKINPSIDDWNQVDVVCTYLKLFYDAASILTAPFYPPANVFYHEVSKIQLELSHAAMSQDPFVSSLVRPLKEKFDQYWKESFLVLAIAVVMDPRFKMKLVEFSFSKIFGENAGSWIKAVDDGIHELFLDYVAPPQPPNLMLQGNTCASQSDTPEGVVLLPQLDGPSHEFSSLEGQSLQMQGNTHIHHSDVPQEVVFVPQMDGPSEEYSSFEGHSQGASCKELHPEEKKPQELHPQGLLPQVMQHEAAYPEEMFSQGFSSGEGSHQQDVHTEDLPQEIHTQELSASEMNTQVVRAGEVNTQEVPAEEMDTQEGPDTEMQAQELSEKDRPQDVPLDEKSEGVPSQELPQNTASEEKIQPGEQPSSQNLQAQELLPEEIRPHGLPSQETQPHEAPCSDDMHMQDVTPLQETNTEGVSTQEAHLQGLPAEEMQTEEVSTQDVDMQEVPPAEELHAQEAPAVELVTDKAPSEKLVPQEAPAQELISQEPTAQALVPQDALEQVPVPQDAPGQKSVPQDVPAQGSVPQEKPAQGSVPQEKTAQGSVPEEQPAQESDPQEQPAHPEKQPAQELDPQEQPAQESDPQEQPAQELDPQEQPAQESVPHGAPAQESVPQEAPAQESVPQGQPAQESVPREQPAQESVPQGQPAQESVPREQPAQESVPQEHTGQESVPQEQPAQVSIQEAPAQDLLPLKAPVQELHPPEPPAQELLPEEAPAQQFPEEPSSQEMLLEGVPIQGMVPHGTQPQEDLHMAQDMQHQVLPQGVQNPVNPQDLLMLSGGNGLSDFEVYISAIGSQHMKSELDQYLEESLLPRVQEFDVLGWWKLNKLKYPTLSKLAADILSIPISTVGPESVFDTVSKKIDSYHGSLHPLTLEAIICAKDWLQHGPSSPSSQMEASNAPLKLEY